jgi:hypothetical protein
VIVIVIRKCGNNAAGCAVSVCRFRRAIGSAAANGRAVITFDIQGGRVIGGSPQVAIIGARPYGLSIAARLRARGIDFHVFGSPMQSWRARMLMGMFLKSKGFASIPYDLDDRFTLRQFCAQYGFAYGDMRVPVSRETMTAYGLSFQKQLG